MAEEKKGLLSRLIDDRNRRMEEQLGGGLAAPQEEAAPAEPLPPPDEEFKALLDASAISARRYLQERIDSGEIGSAEAEQLKQMLPEKQRAKLKDPNPQSSVTERPGAAGLAQPENEEFDEAFAGHPGFQALEADEPASPELESELAKKVVSAREYIFNEGNYPKVLANLNKRGTDFFESAADTAFHIALSEHNKATGRGEVENPAVYFGDGGLLSTMVDTVFEIAQHHDIPGAYDPNEYAAAMGYAYQLAGEHIMENGDENAIAEAQELMADVALTREDGSMVETRDDAMAVRQQRNSMQQQDAAAFEAAQAAMPNESFASPKATMRQLPGGIG